MTYARPVVVSIRGLTVLFTLAEREGFEPPLPFRVIQFSRLTQSTTLPSLRIWVTNGNRTHDTRYHKPLLYQLSYSHHVKLIVIDFIRNPALATNCSKLHTPLESWVLLPILSVYPRVTSLHAYQPTLCTINFVVKVGLEPNTVQDGLDNLITSRVQMVMDRGVFRTWVPSRITST